MGARNCPLRTGRAGRIHHDACCGSIPSVQLGPMMVDMSRAPRWRGRKRHRSRVPSRRSSHRFSCGTCDRNASDTERVSDAHGAGASPGGGRSCNAGGAAKSHVEAPPAAALPVQKVSAPPPVSGDWHDILLGARGQWHGPRTRPALLTCSSVEDNKMVVLCLSPAHRHLQIKPRPGQAAASTCPSTLVVRPLQLRIDLDEVAGDHAGRQRLSGGKQRASGTGGGICLSRTSSSVRSIDLFDATL